MSDEDKPKSFEETLRAIADEVTRGFERAQQGDFEDIARSYGVDPERAKRFVEGAGDWLRAQADNLGGTPFPGAVRPPEPTTWEDPLRGAGPDPLDVPTAEQGRALAALDSGRWTVEPGTRVLASHGEGPGPSDALGLVRELRVRDWIDAEGEVTLVGRHALSRWLDTAERE
ncbi:MAG TPA: hypothetical protein VFG79_01780 [Solirubrobacter sp.]|nr:hypothetical protein [Solirubrobacter sp.]